MFDPKLSIAQQEYEQDRIVRPNYHDGTPRPAFDKLSEIAKRSWIRKI